MVGGVGGYVALWLWTIVAILLATGWRKQLTDNENPLLLFVFASGLGMLVLLAPFQSGNWTLYPAWLWWMGWSVAAFASTCRGGRLVLQVNLLLLLTFVGLLLHILDAMQPSLVIFSPLLDSALLLGLLAGVAGEGFREQVSLALLAVIQSTLVLQLLQVLLYDQAAHLGEPALWDRLAVSMATARGAGLLLDWLKGIVRYRHQKC